MGETSEIVVLADKATVVKGSWVEGEPYVTPEDLETVLGWQVKPEGLCKNDACIPIGNSINFGEGDYLNLEEAATLVGHPSLSAPEVGMITIGQAHDVRSKALKDRVAPNFTLSDISGVDRSMSDWTGKKRLLVAFSSW
jgi:hypothetical protein